MTPETQTQTQLGKGGNDTVEVTTGEKPPNKEVGFNIRCGGCVGCLVWCAVILGLLVVIKFLWHTLWAI